MLAVVELAKNLYEGKPRLAPGLLATLPLLLLLVCVYGARHPILTALLSMLAGCSAIYIPASVARVRVKTLQDKPVQWWDVMPTNLATRDCDQPYEMDGQ